MPLYHSVDEDGAVSFCNKLADIPGELASSWDSILQTLPLQLPLSHCAPGPTWWLHGKLRLGYRLSMPLSPYVSRPHRTCSACALRDQLLLAMTGAACLHSRMLHSLHSSLSTL